MLPLGTQFSFVAVSVFLAVRNHLFVNHCYTFFYVRTLGSTGYKKRETRQKAKVSLEILKKLTINFFPNSLIHVPAS